MSAPPQEQPQAATATATTSENKPKDNNKKQHHKKQDNNNNKKKDSSEQQQQSKKSSSPPAATHVAVHFALATRVPKENGGGIMSIAAVCFNADTRTIVDTFERNVLPSVPETQDGEDFNDLESYRQSFLIGKNVSSSFPNIMNADTAGYWGSSTRRKEYRAVTENAVHPRDMMKDLYDFCKKHGGSRITMVCNPLGAFFSFILHYQERYLMSLGKDYQSPPWGFGALCVRSFCSGVLGGLPMSQVATNKKYVEQFCEGFDPNQTLQPIASAVVAAVAFINASSSCNNNTNTKAEENNEKNGNDDVTEQQQTPSSSAVKWNCPIPTAAAKGYQIPDPVADIFKNPFVPPSTSTTSKNNNNKKQQQKDQEPSTTTTTSNDNKAPQLLLYPSITDADFSFDDVETTIASWAKDKHPKIDWVAQEKVHGSNLSIALDPNSGDVYAARREAPLTLKEASAFFCFDYLIQDIRPELLKIVENVKKNLDSNSNDNNLILVQFFGEICGGDYVVPSSTSTNNNCVAPVIGASRVQRGIMYSPWHCYYVFDCVVHYKNNNNDEQVARYLSYDELDGFFNNNNAKNTKMKQLLLAPVLARGSFEELNKTVPCEFESKFGSWVALPPIKKNFAEGIILRPVQEREDQTSLLFPLSVLAKSTSTSSVAASTNNGNDDDQPASSYYYRPLIKKKHPMFREFVSTQQVFDKMPVSQLFSRMVTVARVASVISKMTKTERDNEEKVVSSMIADVIKDVKEIVKNRNKNVKEGDEQQQQVVFDEKAAAKDENNKILVCTAVRSYFGGGN